MADKLWKANERWWAAYLTQLTGTPAHRNPINGRGKLADVSHKDYPTECKERGTVPSWIIKALDQAEDARTNGEETVVVQIHVKNKPHEQDIIMMRLPTFESFINKKQTKRKARS